MKCAIENEGLKSALILLDIVFGNIEFHFPVFPHFSKLKSGLLLIKSSRLEISELRNYFTKI